MQTSPRLQRLLTFLPWLAAIGMASAVLFGWQVLDGREQAQIRLTTTSASRFVEVLIRRDLGNRLAALDRLAQRWEGVDKDSRSDWEADVGNYITQQPGYRDIAWLDSSLHARWEVSSPLYSSRAKVVLGQDARVLDSAERARQTRSTILSPLLHREGESPQLAIVVPVGKVDHFDGFIVGMLDVNDWLSSVLVQSDRSTYRGHVSIDGTRVFGLAGEQDIAPASWRASRDFLFHGLTWTVEIAPTTEYLSTIHSRLSTGLLIFGLGFSFLTGWIVHLALAARRRAQQLQASTYRHATLLKNLPGMAYRCINGKRWVAEFVSEGCQALSGYTKEEFERNQVSWNDMVLPEDRERLWLSVQEAIQSGTAFEDEYRITARDGTVKWVWGRGRAVESSEENTVHLEGFITDITARKAAEAALRNAETYAKAVVDNAVEAVITIDDRGHIETFNQAAQLMFDYEHDEVRGANIRILMPEPYHSEHDDYIKRYLSTGERRIIGSGRNVTGRRKNGETFPIHLSVSEIVGRDERKFVGLIRDLSEQQAAEHEVREHRERLAHIDRLNTLGEMATGIAHEVNQPLTAISMYAQSGIRFLESGSAATERMRDVLEKVSRQAHRAGAVIERVQQMTRRRESRRESIDCNALMLDVHKLAESEARIRDFRILLDPCPGLPIIEVDPVQIQQVALNLLRNGMEAMSALKVTGSNTITLKTRIDDESVVVSVIDSGTGVPVEVAENIYQPFSSTKETGMGMGLSICRSIITAHGGRIGFHNNEAGGATFYFTLPIATEQSP